MPQKSASSGPADIISVIITSLKKATDTITLSSLKPNTSLSDIKSQAAKQFNVPADKLRLLLNKKPVSDSKTLQDLLSTDEESELSLSAMFLGGVTPIIQAQSTLSADTVTQSSEDVTMGGTSSATKDTSLLKTEEFWTDLRGFLVQRLKSEEDAENAFAVFRKAWQRSEKR
jgi:hypothetical protein